MTHWSQLTSGGDVPSLEMIIQSLDASLGMGGTLRIPASKGQLVYISSSHNFTSQKNVQNNLGELHRL